MRCTLDALIPDARLRSQIAEVLPKSPEHFASLQIRSGGGPVLLVISLNRDGCSEIELAAPFDRGARGE